MFIHLDKHLDRAWDIFWIKLLNCTFLALQIKAFGPKKFKFHAGVKKCHFGNFSEWAGMAVPCLCSPQESLTGNQKFFLIRVAINP